MALFKRQLVLRSVAACGVALVMSCKREERSFRVPPPVAELSETFEANTPVRPGPDAPGTASTSQPVNLARVIYEPYGQQFPNNAQALSDGQLLYEAYNCAGCHAHGGGGMAPPL